MNSIQQIIEGIETVVTDLFPEDIKSVYFEKYTDTRRENAFPQLSYYFSEDMVIDLNANTLSLEFELLDQISGLNNKDERRKNVVSDNFQIASSLISKLKELRYYFQDSINVEPLSSVYKDGLGGVRFQLSISLSKSCSIISTSVCVKSGTLLPPILWGGQKTEIYNGDTGFRFNRGDFTRIKEPKCPEFIQILDFDSAEPYLTLKFENRYGNKDRFTAEDGTQVYSNLVFVDNLYEIMYYAHGIVTIGFVQALMTTALASTHLGFNNWGLSSLDNTLAISNENDGGYTGFGQLPFDLAANARYWTASQASQADRSMVYLAQLGGNALVVNNVVQEYAPMFYSRNMNQEL